jgi:hypothetical protein
MDKAGWGEDENDCFDHVLVAKALITKKDKNSIRRTLLGIRCANTNQVYLKICVRVPDIKIL